VADESLQEVIARFAREKAEADERYNAALTALDRALAGPVDWPELPPGPEYARSDDLNRLWNVTLPDAPGARSLSGWVRRLVRQVVAPALDAQRHFNSALVDHANRTAADAVARSAAIQSALETLKTHADARTRFESHLIQFLQTITWYVDTKDRSIESASLVLNAGLSAITDDWMKRWESLKTREDRLLRETGALREAFDATRATSNLAQQTTLSFKRDVETLLTRTVAGPETDKPPSRDGQAEAPPAPDLDAYTYLSFENEFRGSREDIRERLAGYLPHFAGRTDVLEIGCGRGEFLDLLREHCISARGLDINDAMVRETRDRGLDAVRADALEYLQAQPDESLGGLFAAQVVEHLPPSYLSRLIDVAGQKLRPGGLLIFETINPTCWLAFFESYIRDLTHVKPLHPDTLRFLVRAAGFSRVDIELKAPVPEAQRLRGLPWEITLDDPSVQDTLRALVSRLNEQTTMLNDRLFGFQDYAVIGEK
jgi:SAM-dependent methyltransferase